jgi:hypothetical protein
MNDQTSVDQHPMYDRQLLLAGTKRNEASVVHPGRAGT